MPYAKESPLKDKVIRHMVASACFAEIALAAGEWNPTRLEELIEGRYYHEQTGKFRRMAGGVVPDDDTTIHVDVVFKGKCNVREWRDHPIWTLLDLYFIKHKDIESALQSGGMNSEIWKYIWKSNDPPFVFIFPFERRQISQKDITQIARTRSLNSLMALLAIGREEMERSNRNTYYRASEKSLDIFPYVVGSTPQLYICWKPLMQRITHALWESFLSDPDKQVVIEPEKIERKIHQARLNAEKRGVSFPPPDILERHNRIIKNR